MLNLLAIDEQLVIGVAGLFVALVGLAVAYAAWHRPRQPSTTVPSFGRPGDSRRIGHGDAGRDFIRFLEKHAAGKVYINVWFRPEEFPDVRPEGSVLGARAFAIEDNVGVAIPNQHVQIYVEDVQDSQLSYSGGTGWTLRGYFAIESCVVRMGSAHWRLVPISVKEAVS